MVSERQLRATRRIEEILRKRGCELADKVASVIDVVGTCEGYSGKDCKP